MTQWSIRRFPAYPFIRIFMIGLVIVAFARNSFNLVQGHDSSELATQSKQNIETLETGRPVEQELKAGEVHDYQIRLVAGQFLRVIVEQRGIDVVVALISPTGKQIIEVDSPNGTQGSEPVSAIAEVSGIYSLQIRSLEKDVPTGRYEVKIANLRIATDQDKSRIMAERASLDAGLLLVQGTTESLQKSIERYSEALPFYRAAGDQAGEAETLTTIGSIYSSMGEKQKALDHYAQVLPLTRAIGDRRGEATTLNSLGKNYDDLGQKRTAINYYEQALAIYVALNDRRGQAILLNNIAVAYNDMGETRKALDNLAQSLDLRRATGDRNGEARMLTNIGSLYNLMGENRKALNYHLQALAICRDIKAPGAEATTLSNIGKVYDDLGDKPGAIERYTQALPLARAVEDRSDEATTLNRLGSAYASLDENRKALDHYAQALALTRAIADRRGEATTLNNMGMANDSLGEKQKALDYFAQAMVLALAIGDRHVEAAILNNSGDVYNSIGESQKALDKCGQALLLMRAARDRRGEAASLNNIGKAYDDLGEKQKALDHYAGALSLTRAAGDRSGEAVTLNNIGRVYDSLGEKQKALDNYLQALPLMRGVKNQSGEAASHNNIAFIFDTLGEKQKALDHYTQALSLYRVVEDRRGEATSLNNIASIFDYVGETQKALDLYLQALPIRRALRDRDGEAATLNNIGSVYDNLGEKQKALDHFAQALEITRAIGDRRGEAILLNNIGYVYGELGEKQKAVDYYSQALPIRRAVGDHRGEAATLNSLGAVYDLLGEKQKALELHLQAISALESIRAATTIEEIKVGLAEDAVDAYQRASLLLMSFGQPEQAFNLTERARSRTLLDQLGNIRPNLRKTADIQRLREEQGLVAKLSSIEARLRREQAKPTALQNANEISSLKAEIAFNQRRLEELIIHLKLTNPEYVTLRSVNTLKLTEIQELLDRNTSLISYFITPDKALAFIITRTSFQPVELSVKESDLNAAISWFRNFASLDDLKPESLRRLHDWLITPLKRYIKTPVLGIIPHGMLHYLPFSALIDGTAYFGEQHALFYLPSASVLPFIKNKRKSVGSSVLAVAQSHVVGAQVLQHADREVRAIANLYNAKAFTTGHLSKADFLKRVNGYGIVHIAAHAELNAANPLFSKISLAPDEKKEGEDADGSLYVKDLYNLRLNKASLVVLSACETQLGRYSMGDDIIGLNRAFIYSGTPTVIASLWVVDDESTSYLMKAFYTNLKRGMSKVSALRAAQSYTSRKYPHPYYWAGFVLSGDPGMK